MDIEAIRRVIQENADAVEYKPETHQYFMEGAEVPSVSRLERPITDAELACIPTERLEMARQRGTMVHEAINSYLSTGFDLSKGECALYMKQAKRFLKEYEVVMIAHEVILRNMVYGFAGRTDLIGILRREQFIRPVDWKVTYDINASVALQLNFYESCLYSYKLNGCPLPVAEGVVVHLDLDDYKVVPAGEIADRDTTVAAARGLVSVNTFRTRYIKK